MKTIRGRGLWTAALVAVIVVGVQQRAPASGIPSQTPLFYSGALEDNGTPVDGMRAFTLILWDSPTANGAANNKCQTTAPTTQVTRGRFRIALDATCTAAIAQNPDLFVEVIVGATSLGRKKLGAVPYALEAQTASNAAGALASQVVPAGAVMHFEGACPSGWTELVEARGRYLVGLQPGGTSGAVVGNPLANTENRAVGQHTHTVNESPHSHSTNNPAHAHSASSSPHKHTIGLGSVGGGFPWFHTNVSFGAGDALDIISDTSSSVTVNAATTNVTVNGATTGVSVNATGATAGTNAPYLQLRVCKKS